MTQIQTTAGPSSVRVEIDRIDQTKRSHIHDSLTIEEPLEMRLVFHAEGKRQQRRLSITMRTPGHDEELVAGFLHSEGIAHQTDELIKIAHCGPAAGDLKIRNVIKAELHNNVSVDWSRLERHFATNSSCGICGKASLEAVKVGIDRVTAPDFVVDFETLTALPDRLRAEQAVFESTGGLHAAALFDHEGNLLRAREDVGRHNAVDKLIGAEFLAGRLPFAEPRILLLSGRACFELIQKAAVAGIGMIAAIGAPSSLAVDLAREAGITLIGFLRNGRCNVYCGSHRLDSVPINAT